MLSVPYKVQTDGGLKIPAGWLSLVNANLSSGDGFAVSAETSTDPPAPLNRVYYKVSDLVSGTYSTQGITTFAFGTPVDYVDGFLIVAQDESGLGVTNGINFVEISTSGYQVLTQSSPPFVSTATPSMGVRLAFFRNPTINAYIGDCYLSGWGFALVISLATIKIGTFTGMFFRYLPAKNNSWTNPNWVTKNQVRAFGTQTVETVYTVRTLREVYDAGIRLGQLIDESFLGQIFFIGSL